MREHDVGGQQETEACDDTEIDPRLGFQLGSGRCIFFTGETEFFSKADADVLLRFGFGKVFVWAKPPLRRPLDGRKLLIFHVSA